MDDVIRLKARAKEYLDLAEVTNDESTRAGRLALAAYFLRRASERERSISDRANDPK